MGWCHEGGELLLVYDYFPLGSLDKLLFANGRATALSPGTPELTWDRRFRIICGVASALDYLHHGSSKRILHRDVKAGNVMLDVEYNARLGDFGLARAIQLEGVTHHSTQAVAGTRGVTWRTRASSPAVPASTRTWDNSDLFTLMIDHNGFFGGLRENLCYMCGTVDFFDDCSHDTFSLLWIQDFLSRLGHEMDGRLHVYWLKPGMDLMDGLQCIESDNDIVDMIEAAKVEKTLSIMVDHTNFLKTLRYDVLVNGGRKNTKPIKVTAGEGSTNSLAIAPSVVHAQGTRGGGNAVEVEGDNDSDSDCSFADSDFDVEDGDDDLFADNVDREVDGHNEQDSVFELEDDDALQDTTLNLRLEEEQHLKNKFKEFNPKIDMQNPIFKDGMNFSYVEELRKALNAYSVKNKVKVNKLKNDSTRITAVCKSGCPWFMRATKDIWTEGFTIKKLYTWKHTCRGSWDLKALTSPFLTERFLDEIRDNQNISLKTFAAKVQRQFNMSPNRD
ncbi:hypothetical protein ACQ4PT_022979 [Festuca glaucescens]